MKKYRRIEVNAFRRRVTVVSGEWTRDISGAEAAQTDGILLDDEDAIEPVQVESAEGQLILADAVRSLEGRLTPETRTAMFCSQQVTPQTGPSLNAFCRKLLSIFQLIYARSLRKEK